MKYHKPGRLKKTREKTSRLSITMAIVFLFGALIMYRLFQLQVVKSGYYTELASGQHEAFTKIESKRGSIYMYDKVPGGTKVDYAMAINKEFANVYVIPKVIKNPVEMASRTYEILDRAKIERSIEDGLKNDEEFSELKNATTSSERSKELTALFQEKKIIEIEKKQKEVIDKYIGIFGKKNDPYESLKRKVSDEEFKKFLELKSEGIEGIGYELENYRYYPEGEVGSHILGFVGYSGDEKKGSYGLEGRFNDELSGQSGSVRTERSANRDPIIVNDREYVKPVDGGDLYLTINRSIQFEVCKRLRESVLRHGADSGLVIVLEPYTGAIMAMCSFPDYDPNNYSEYENKRIFNNPAIYDSYEPGSTFKAITMAAGLNEGKVNPDSTYEDKGYLNIEGWPKPIKNSDFETHGGHGKTDMNTVLNYSLNTGAIHVMKKIGASKFAEYVENFGFRNKTGIELETEGTSNVSSLFQKKIKPIEAATAAFGQGITATPLQMILAYAAIANGGILMKPYLVEKIVSADGQELITHPQQVRRVISEKTALLLAGMLVNVVEIGHSPRAKVKGYYVAGKTGTAQIPDKVHGGYRDNEWMHTFIGFTPVDDPKFVMLVKIENPKDVRFADSSSAPLFGELSDYILNYLQVKKER